MASNCFRQSVKNLWGWWLPSIPTLWGIRRCRFNRPLGLGLNWNVPSFFRNRNCVYLSAFLHYPSPFPSLWSVIRGTSTMLALHSTLLLTLFYVGLTQALCAIKAVGTPHDHPDCVAMAFRYIVQKIRYDLVKYWPRYGTVFYLPLNNSV